MSRITRVPGKKKGSTIERKTISNRKLERQIMKNQLGNNRISREWSNRQERRYQEAKRRMQGVYATATDWSRQTVRFACTLDHALRCLSMKMRGRRGVL